YVQQSTNSRLECATFVDCNNTTSLAGPKYETLFLDKLKLDMRKGPLPPLVAQVKGSDLRHVLVAALDHWAEITMDKALLPCLLEVARLADPDPWRGPGREWPPRPELAAP